MPTVNSSCTDTMPNTCDITPAAASKAPVRHTHTDGRVQHQVTAPRASMGQASLMLSSRTRQRRVSHKLLRPCTPRAAPASYCSPCARSRCALEWWQTAGRLPCPGPHSRHTSQSLWCCCCCCWGAAGRRLLQQVPPTVDLQQKAGRMLADRRLAGRNWLAVAGRAAAAGSRKQTGPEVDTGPGVADAGHTHQTQEVPPAPVFQAA